MKIGILTFHWATNYGAVLQTYATQKYLESIGHEVEIINYKPWHYDFIPRYIRRPWLLRGIITDLVQRKKEKRLAAFRSNHLNMTERFYSCESISAYASTFDVVISGSDQILNPSYTLTGENKPTSTYYLSFATKSVKIGYAVSFGCDNYPEEAKKYASKWVDNFDAIGCRENTGLDIVKSFNYKNTTSLVPDPTILCGKTLFDGLVLEENKKVKEDYLCVYILRSNATLDKRKYLFIDDTHNPLSLEEWVKSIIESKGLITNSYHGMIVALLNHIPFAVLLDSKTAGRMNNRFTTLLSRLGLLHHICSNESECLAVIEKDLDWEDIEAKISKFRQEGVEFLNKYIQ